MTNCTVGTASKHVFCAAARVLGLALHVQLPLLATQQRGKKNTQQQSATGGLLVVD